jgi:hypothetical protein
MRAKPITIHAEKLRKDRQYRTVVTIDYRTRDVRIQSLHNADLNAVPEYIYHRHGVRYILPPTVGVTKVRRILRTVQRDLKVVLDSYHTYVRNGNVTGGFSCDGYVCQICMGSEFRKAGEQF